MSWIPARELYICWIEDPRYWKWTRLEDCCRTEVAELLNVCWLDIMGKKDLKHLCSSAKFGAYLVYKLRPSNNDPLQDAKTSVRIVKDKLDNTKEANAVALESHHRKDGWMEVKLGDFFNRCGEQGDVEMRLYDTGSRWKSGLLVRGIEVRPI